MTTKTCSDWQVESDRSILDNYLLPAFGRFFVTDIDVRRIDADKASKRRERESLTRGTMVGVGRCVVVIEPARVHDV